MLEFTPARLIKVISRVKLIPTILLILALSHFILELVTVTNPNGWSLYSFRTLSGVGIGVSLVQAILSVIIIFMAFQFKTYDTKTRKFYSFTSTRLFLSSILGMLIVFINIVFSVANYMTENYRKKENQNYNGGGWSDEHNQQTAGAARAAILCIEIALGSGLATLCFHYKNISQAAGLEMDEIEANPIIKKIAGSVPAPPPVRPGKTASVKDGGDKINANPSAPTRDVMYEEIPFKFSKSLEPVYNNA
jgi:MFS family permease